MWNSQYEAMSTDEMNAFQLDKLKETVAWLYERVPFYQNKFKELGVEPGDVKTVGTWVSCPLRSKTILGTTTPLAFARCR
jgi:phenylacetate-CoA ligase